MKGKIYIKPLKEYLSEEIHPKQLAQTMDELAYDYIRMIIRLQQTEDEKQLFIHPDASSFLFHLKSLRDALRKCHV